MSDRTDLTRWNRAGLSRFTYVDGNAVEYLELLRRQLVDKFGGTDWLQPAEIEPDNEKPVPGEPLLDEQKKRHVREQRLLRMYRQDPKDWAWEISRTFARACHILTGYADAWANEGYLGTATQWENVRRLVGLLDYNPAPPASATTPLVLLAKPGTPSIVEKGFQVKNNPPKGANKAIFETLDDLFVDARLNRMQPKGWDKSNAPVVSDDAGETIYVRSEATKHSELSTEPVIHIQGVADSWNAYLNDKGIFRIGDFLDLDLGSQLFAGLSEGRMVRLREIKAKAIHICQFEIGDGWQAYAKTNLADIAAANAADLAERTGNSLASVEALQQRIEMIGACLDNAKFKTIKLHQIVTTLTRIEGVATTAWYANRVPKVEAGQVAMVFHQSGGVAEATTIAEVEKESHRIKLKPGSQSGWKKWPQSEAVLYVAPRWKRACWLNGRNVIRTEQAHGLGAGSFVCWRDRDGRFRYAKVAEADKRNLRLKLLGGAKLPEAGDELIVAMPFFARQKMPAHYKALNEEAAGVKATPGPLDAKGKAPNLPFETRKIFPLDADSGSSGGGGGVLPPASLSGLGSFLFPTPFLPMDLVKFAVDMLLNLGVMVIPSTGDVVIKGMPFGGMLDGAASLDEAATKLIELLDSVAIEVQWQGGVLVDTSKSKNAVYLELTCKASKIPEFIKKPEIKVVDSSGKAITVLKPSSNDFVDGLTCSEGGKVLFNGKPVGYQPASSVGASHDGLVVFRENKHWLKQVQWNLSDADGAGSIEDRKREKIKALISKESPALFQSIEPAASPASGAAAEQLLAIPEEKPHVQAVVIAADPLYVFEGSAGKVEAGDWVVGEFGDGFRAMEIIAINDFTEADKSAGFSIDVGSETGELISVYANFRDRLVPMGAGRNEEQVDSEIPLEPLPESLKPGRKVLLQLGDKLEEARIIEVTAQGIVTDPPATGCKKADLVIYGNVVTASHGVVKPAAILGSGSAARTNQEFTLAVAGVSFTPDATMSSGVAAAIEVVVDSRIWTQVSTLQDAAPDDHHYAVRMTEEGYVRILFGDGTNGRRLPTGTNNVRVRYRVGSGLAGNQPAESLVKIVNPHPLVDAVLQPVRAAGGGEMEDVASLRENAPSTLLALERAVSLSDFTALATSRSNIWQASTVQDVKSVSRDEQAIVTVVPADGVYSPDIEENVRKFLQAHALPGVRVRVREFTRIDSFDLDITIRLDTGAFLPEVVKAEVRAALEEQFKLKNRRLGASLFLSEVYKIVEGIRGVENSLCKIRKDDKEWRVLPAGNVQSVVCLDPARLNVDHEEYRL